MARGTRIFYASDIHGSERCFLKFLGAAKFYGARVLILGGDITGKVVVPLIHRGTGYEANFLGRMHRVESAEEIEALEKAIRFNGFYPVRLEPDEYEAISADELRQNELFRELVLASLRRWMELAEERLKGLGVRCFVNPGNDDESFVDEVLGESDYVENMDGGVARIDEEHEMVVVGYSNQTPLTVLARCPKRSWNGISWPWRSSWRRLIGRCSPSTFRRTERVGSCTPVAGWAGGHPGWSHGYDAGGEHGSAPGDRAISASARAPRPRT